MPSNKKAKKATATRSAPQQQAAAPKQPAAAETDINKQAEQVKDAVENRAVAAAAAAAQDSVQDAAPDARSFASALSDVPPESTQDQHVNNKPEGPRKPQFSRLPAWARSAAAAALQERAEVTIELPPEVPYVTQVEVAKHAAAGGEGFIAIRANKMYQNIRALYFCERWWGRKWMDRARIIVMIKTTGSYPLLVLGQLSEKPVVEADKQISNVQAVENRHIFITKFGYRYYDQNTGEEKAFWQTPTAVTITDTTPEALRRQPYTMTGPEAQMKQAQAFLASSSPTKTHRSEESGTGWFPWARNANTGEEATISDCMFTEKKCIINNCVAAVANLTDAEALIVRRRFDIALCPLRLVEDYKMADAGNLATIRFRDKTLDQRKIVEIVSKLQRCEEIGCAWVAFTANNNLRMHVGKKFTLHTKSKVDEMIGAGIKAGPTGPQLITDVRIDTSAVLSRLSKPKMTPFTPPPPSTKPRSTRVMQLDRSIGYAVVGQICAHFQCAAVGLDTTYTEQAISFSVEFEEGKAPEGDTFHYVQLSDGFVTVAFTKNGHQ